MSGVPASKSQNEDVFPVGGEALPRLHAVSADSDNDSENDSASRTPDERRGAERLRPENLAGIAQEVSDAEEEQRFYLPRHGRGMTVSLIVAFGIAYFVTPTWPGPSPTIAALFSMALFASYGWFAAVERRNESVLPLRIALLVIANIVPMLCAGYALAAGISSGAPLPWAVATLVCINAAAAVLFSGRIASLFCANIASWAGFVVFAAPGLHTYAALAGAAVTLILIARIECRAADRRRALREARFVLDAQPHQRERMLARKFSQILFADGSASLDPSDSGAVMPLVTICQHILEQSIKTLNSTRNLFLTSPKWMTF
jgi:hypothetical protein